MQLEEEYIHFLGAVFESSENSDVKKAVKEIGERFLSLLEARGGNYNKYWTMHVGEGYGDHKFGDRIRAGGQKAKQMAEFQLKLVDPKSDENKALERKVINDFIREYGIRVSPVYYADGKLKEAVFRDNMYINSDGVIYTKNAEGKVIPVGREQISNPPTQDGEELYANAGDELPDELMSKYADMRNDAIEARMSWYDARTTFYNRQATAGSELSEYDTDDSMFERSLVGDNAQPIGTSRELGTNFSKETTGSIYGEGKEPRVIEKKDTNTSVGLGAGIMDEATAIDMLLKEFPDFGKDSLRKVINTALSKHGSVMVSTINDARKYIYSIMSSINTIPHVKDKLVDINSDGATSSEIASILNIINEFILPNAFNKTNSNYGINSTNTTFKKIFSALEEYSGENKMVNKRNTDAIRQNIVTFMDEFIGNTNIGPDGKYVDDTALLPKLYNMLTDISTGAMNNA